jgi:hypothetical protein
VQLTQMHSQGWQAGLSCPSIAEFSQQLLAPHAHPHKMLGDGSTMCL